MDATSVLKLTRFPDKRAFAFTIFDDTDFSTVENTRPVYEFLAELGFRTTKSVWPLKEVASGEISGATLQDRDYLRFVLHLREQGFEIALHNVRNHDAARAMVQDGLKAFRESLGPYPRTHANHNMNRDNLYWGEQRLTSRVFRMGHRLVHLARRRPRSEGHIPKSKYFWGDICRDHISYVRNFVFREVNLDRINPSMPYHDPRRPFVNFWFSGCEGANVNTFCEMLSETNQQRLEAEAGVCIMYTHFSQGFFRDGELDRRFVRLMRRLASKNGWFVPVATLLDHLHHQRGGAKIPAGELMHMERYWVMQKLTTGTR